MAIRYRDRIVASVERRTARKSPGSHTLPGTRNRSGVVGVTRIVQQAATGTRYAFWQASWTTSGGGRRAVRYSILKLGEEEAFRRACRSRREARG